MKTILLIKTAEIFHNDETPQAVPHGGLGYIASSLLQKGFGVILLDVLAEGFNEIITLNDEWFRVGLSGEKLREGIAQISPDFIGISAQFTSQHEMLEETVSDVRSVTGAPIVVGGIHAHYMPKFVLSIKGVDYVLRGEVEETLPILINASSADLEKIPGLSFIREGEIIHNPIGCYPDLDKLPYPARHLFPGASGSGDAYSAINSPHGHRFEGKNLPYYEIITSRGCNYKCAGCAGSDFAGGNRTRKASDVLSEIELLIDKFGMKSLAVIDDNFIQDKERAIVILKELVRRRYNLNLTFPNGLLIRNLFSKDGRVDGKFIDLLRMAGTSEVDLPIETATLRIMRDFLTNKYDINLNLEKLCKVLSGLGIKVSGYFMLGFPYETMEEMEATINLGERLRKNGMNNGWPFLVAPFPGSRFWQNGEIHSKLELRRLRFRMASGVNKNFTPSKLQLILEEAKRRLGS